MCSWSYSPQLPRNFETMIIIYFLFSVCSGKPTSRRAITGRGRSAVSPARPPSKAFLYHRRQCRPPSRKRRPRWLGVHTISNPWRTYHRLTLPTTTITNNNIISTNVSETSSVAISSRYTVTVTVAAHRTRRQSTTWSKC